MSDHSVWTLQNIVRWGSSVSKAIDFEKEILQVLLLFDLWKILDKFEDSEDYKKHLETWQELKEKGEKIKAEIEKSFREYERMEKEGGKFFEEYKEQKEKKLLEKKLKIEKKRREWGLWCRYGDTWEEWFHSKDLNKKTWETDKTKE